MSSLFAYLYNKQRYIWHTFAKLKYEFLYGNYNKDANAIFSLNGVDIEENLISELDCTQLIENFSIYRKYSENDIFKSSKNIYDFFLQLKENSLIYWSFPKSVFRDYEFVYSPVKQISLIKVIVNQLIPKFESRMRTNVSVEIVDLYLTKGNIPTSHVNSTLHKDGDFQHSMKAIVYLNDCLVADDGPLKVVLNSGEEELMVGKAGTVVFFKASDVLHAGLSPKFDRYCLNLKVYPTLLKSSVRVVDKVNILSRLFYI